MNKGDFELLVEGCRKLLAQLKEEEGGATQHYKKAAKFTKEFVEKFRPEISTQEKII